MSDIWLEASACDLGRGIEDGDIDPRDLTEVYLDAIANHPEAPRIYARVTPGRARAEAAAAAERLEEDGRLSLLDGVPISWKDLFDTAGVATEAGSAILHGRIPDEDCVVLNNASQAGLVCLGKTHMSEFAFSGLGVNPVTATSPNVNDPEGAPGGSSSGAAASVAFNLAPSGIGSDTGGSVRAPSAWNDLVGFKTTHGRLSLDGVVPLCARFDTIGPLGRTVEDAAHITAAMLGEEPPELDANALSGAQFVIPGTVMLEEVEDAPMAAFEDALRRLEAAGATLTEMEIPEIAAIQPLGGPLFTAEAYGAWGAEISANPGVVFGPVEARFLSGASVSSAEYDAAWAELLRLRKAFAARMEGMDGLIAPTCPILPPNVARLMADEEYYTHANLLALRNTRVGNMLDQCGLTLPTTAPSCGLMILTGPGRDDALLGLGLGAEAALRG